MSYVYVVESDSGTVKIGRSHDPARRVAGLQTANSGAMKLVHTVAVHPRLAAAVEATAHKALASHRLRGEWFSVDARTAAGAVDLAVERHEAAIHPLIAQAISTFEARLRERMERAITETMIELADSLRDLTPTADPSSHRGRQREARTVELAFLEDCVLPEPGERVRARMMYRAYVRFAEGQGREAWTENRLGRWLGRVLKTDRSGSHYYYLECRLVDPRPSDHPQPDQ